MNAAEKVKRQSRFVVPLDELDIVEEGDGPVVTLSLADEEEKEKEKEEEEEEVLWIELSPPYSDAPESDGRPEPGSDAERHEQYAVDREGHEGVWRTIRGRRVFIRTGETPPKRR